MQNRIPGRHIGERPDTAQPVEMQRLHALGYHTIDAETYQNLITAGLEPAEFIAMPVSEIRRVVDYSDLV